MPELRIWMRAWFSQWEQICWDCSDIDLIIIANSNLKHSRMFTASKVAQNCKFPNRTPKDVLHASVCGCKFLLISYSFTSKSIYFDEIRSCHAHATKPVTMKHFLTVQAIVAMIFIKLLFLLTKKTEVNFPFNKKLPV